MVTKLGPLCKVKLLKDKGIKLVVRSPEKAGVASLVTKSNILTCLPVIINPLHPVRISDIDTQYASIFVILCIYGGYRSVERSP